MPNLVNPAPALEKELARYLQDYPLERGALAPLLRQLHDEPETIFQRSNMRGHITASALVLDSAREQVLLIDHIGLNAWLAPGGHYEAGGSVFETALRELAEETGVTRVSALRHPSGCFLLDVDSHPIPARASKKEGAHMHHDFMYVLEAEPGVALTAQVAEVNGVRWLPLPEFFQTPSARNQRIALKLRALLAYWANGAKA